MPSFCLISETFGMHIPISLHLYPYKMILLSFLKLLMMCTDFGSAWQNEKRVKEIMCYSQRNFQLCHSGLFCGSAVTQTIPHSPRKEQRPGSDGLWNIQFLRMELAKRERAGKRNVCLDVFANLKRTSSCSHVHPLGALMGLTPSSEPIAKFSHSNRRGTQAARRESKGRHTRADKC